MPGESDDITIACHHRPERAIRVMWPEKSLLQGGSVIHEYFIAKHLLFVLSEDKRHVCVRDSDTSELMISAARNA